MQVYRPVLAYFLDRPAGIVWFVGLTFVAGRRWAIHAARGRRGPSPWWPAPGRADGRGQDRVVVTLVLAGMIAGQQMTPAARVLTPLDEGMVMDMPITVPRLSAAQAADDLKARDMVFCRFPEVDMVIGKAGRGRDRDRTPRAGHDRDDDQLPPAASSGAAGALPADAERQALAVLERWRSRSILAADAPARRNLANEAAMEAVPLFDAQMRAAYQRNRELEREIGPRLGGSRSNDWRAEARRQRGLVRHDAEGLAPVVDAADRRPSGTPGNGADARGGRVAGARRLPQARRPRPADRVPELARSRPSLLRRGAGAVRGLLGAEEPTLLDG
jgi:hypothetical protein